MNIKLKPLLKYPGGKSSELKNIEIYVPDNINNYIEPFVGGGAVYFYINNIENHNYINDKSEELMLLYKYVRDGNKTFFNELNQIINNWEKLKDLAHNEKLFQLFVNYRDNDNVDLTKELTTLINIDDVPMFNLRSNIKFEIFLNNCMLSKFKLIKKNEIKKNEYLEEKNLVDNLEAGVKAAYYTYLRDVYNNPILYNKLSKPRKVAIYLFIREYCFSSMFRFNKDGGFNVPYGGVSYNNKSLLYKKLYYKTKNLRNLLKNTDLYTLDFYDFVKCIKIDKNDFMFLDPPYDTTFSEYDQNSFNFIDQERLANYLINECPCKFMLVIKKTEAIENLYRNRGLIIKEENKNYFVSFKNRNQKQVKHLIIMNYKK